MSYTEIVNRDVSESSFVQIKERKIVITDKSRISFLPKICDDTFKHLSLCTQESWKKCRLQSWLLETQVYRSYNFLLYTTGIKIIDK